MSKQPTGEEKKESVEHVIIAKVRISKLWANITALLFFFILIAVCAGLASLLPHSNLSTKISLPFFYIGFVLIIIAHEYLHAFAAAKNPSITKNNIQYGFSWKGLMPYCHINTPLPVKAYKTVTILPLYVTISVGIPLLLLFPHGLSVILLSIALTGCTADILMFRQLRSFDDHLLVQDHPSEPGFNVFQAKK